MFVSFLYGKIFFLQLLIFFNKILIFVTFILFFRTGYKGTFMFSNIIIKNHLTTKNQPHVCNLNFRYKTKSTRLCFVSIRYIQTGWSVVVQNYSYDYSRHDAFQLLNNNNTLSDISLRNLYQIRVLDVCARVHACMLTRGCACVCK